VHHSCLSSAVGPAAPCCLIMEPIPLRQLKITDLCHADYPAGRSIVCPAHMPARNIHRNKQNNITPTPSNPPRVSSNFIFFFFFFLLRATVFIPGNYRTIQPDFDKSFLNQSTWFHFTLIPGRKDPLPSARYGILCEVLLQATTGPGSVPDRLKSLGGCYNNCETDRPDP
jgi:hypothetical protein